MDPRLFPSALNGSFRDPTHRGNFSEREAFVIAQFHGARQQVSSRPSTRAARSLMSVAVMARAAPELFRLEGRFGRRHSRLI
jgi:hypothetical protein